MCKKIKVKLNFYSLNTREPKDEQKYQEICETAKSLGHKLFDCISLGKEKSFSDMPEEQTIETKHLFNNQYNTEEGCRVFDWYESIVHTNRKFKQGYYLTGDLEALKSAKENQLVCGYCGARYQMPTEQKWCDKCLSSEYLEEKQLHFLYLLNVVDNEKRHDSLEPMILGEFKKDVSLVENYKSIKDYLLSQVEFKQKERFKIKAQKLLVDAKEKCNSITFEAEIKAELYNLGIDCSDLLFYDHSGHWAIMSHCKKTTPEFIQELKEKKIPKSLLNRIKFKEE